MEKIDLSAKNIVELKAMAYDLNAAIQQYRDLLNVVNQEIAAKINEAENAKTEAKVEAKVENKKDAKKVQPTVEHK